MPLTPDSRPATSLDGGGLVRGVLYAQRMFKTRNRRHLPECIPRLFGVDNVDNKAFEELVRQARQPKADRPKAQLIPARLLSPCCGLCRAVAEVTQG